ncbi:MAG: ribosome biogenesis GTP-binding protein YihA/YsxC [Nitrospinales bacterium]
MKILSAKYMTSAVREDQYPKPLLPEIAFVGRSNVGKSSLINTLLNRKGLVKTSSTPGKTQTINFFQVNDQVVFADLPGYGFAKVPARVQKTWQKMIEDYLLNREVLKSVIFIIDVRRNPTKVDLEMRNWLEESGIDYALAATKTDKVSKKERKIQLTKIREVYLFEEERFFVPFSSKSHEGRREVWNYIAQKIEKEDE